MHGKLREDPVRDHRNDLPGQRRIEGLFARTP
jgi:hypothetical protein